MPGWPRYSDAGPEGEADRAGKVEEAYRQAGGDVRLASGEDVDITAEANGLVFAARGAYTAYTWAELAGIIDNLILLERYPGSAPSLDGYAIPDEEQPAPSFLSGAEKAGVPGRMEDHDRLESAHIEAYIARAP